jgi:glycosyltransferase involved in cell wall biosynthesis
MSTVSLCIIVRNEEIMLERCLASIAAIADEIIIVDTGSTDKTIEIAQKFVEKVYNFKWIDDFAAARNYAQSLATCEYVCRWDADCTLRDGDISKLLAIKNNNFDNADLYNLNYIEQFELDANDQVLPLFQESIFFFYKCSMFFWQSPIHNQLVLHNPKIKPKIVSDNSILVLHHREESSKTWRKKQSLDILKTNLAKKDFNHIRMQYYYARELYFDGNYNEAIEQFQILLSHKIPQDLRDYSIEKIFFALFYSNQNVRIPEFQSLIKSKPSPRLVLLQADILCLADPIAAANKYLEYINKPFVLSDSQYEYDTERFQIHAFIQLAKIQIHNQKLTKASKNLQKALALTVSQETKDRIKKLLEYC